MSEYADWWTVMRACVQWRRQGGEGEASTSGWTSKNYVICVCFHCHGTSSYHTTNTLQGRRATLIHRQYNRDWGTSYSRPPIDPYLTSPCYKILAAPQRVCEGCRQSDGGGVGGVVDVGLSWPLTGGSSTSSSSADGGQQVSSSVQRHSNDRHSSSSSSSSYSTQLVDSLHQLNDVRTCTRGSYHVRPSVRLSSSLTQTLVLAVSHACAYM